jgi:hypothetical protein
MVPIMKMLNWNGPPISSFRQPLKKYWPAAVLSISIVGIFGDKSANQPNFILLVMEGVEA